MIGSHLVTCCGVYEITSYYLYCLFLCQNLHAKNLVFGVNVVSVETAVQKEL